MRKIEKIQERALRFLLNDTKSDYNMLLSISGFETLHLKGIHMFALEIFKCLYDLNHLLCRLLLILNRYHTILGIIKF